MATVKEGLAVAPGLNEIRVLVVRKDRDTATPQDFLGAIYAGRFPRERTNRLDWQRIDPIQELMIAPDALMHRRGSTGEILTLDLKDEPELASVVETLRGSL
jgi:hypothetical protein